MAITTYTELKTAVATWLARSDLTSVIPDFITLAEAEFQRSIRDRRMVTTSDLSTSAGTATVALPADFLEARTLILQSTPYRTLTYATPAQINRNWPSASDTGTPSQYTIIGTNLKLGKIPDAVYTLELEYYQKIPVLSGSNADNWLLLAYPDIYLFASLEQAGFYTKNDRLVSVANAGLRRGMDSLEAEGMRSSWGGGPLAAAVDSTVR